MPDYVVPRDELPYNPSDQASIVEYASLLMGHTLRERCDVEAYSVTKGNKGGFGNALEYCYFKYQPNSVQGPDFPEVGLELKSHPVKRNKNKSLSAKERLVLTDINYCGIVNETWERASLHAKLDNVLLITYLHEPAVDVFDYVVEFAGLHDIPPEDMEIIRQDWEIIVGKVRAGCAHELSSSDTSYLEACTKGASAASVSDQPFSLVKAKRRAFALKASYMTVYYRNGIGLESLIRDRQAAQLGIEGLVKRLFEPFIGKTEGELAELLGVRKGKNAKHFYALLTKAILRVRSDSEVAEFEKAGIMSRSVRIEENGSIRESISFSAFEFEELLAEPSWEESAFGEVCEQRRFLFTVFKKHGEEYVLEGCAFWSMPYDAREKARKTWEETRRIVREGVKLERRLKDDGMPSFSKKGKPEYVNNLPNSTFEADFAGVVHVRPHARESAYRLEDGTEIGNVARDASELPDGRAMTKQCFWINASYIAEQLHEQGF